MRWVQGQPQLAVPRDQRRLDGRPPRDCWVRVENSNKRRDIREGLNQNNGSPQRETIVLLSGLADDEDQEQELRNAARTVAGELRKRAGPKG